MRILALETATTVCGAALVLDGAVVSEHQVEERNVHAENIMGFVDRVLSDGSFTLRSLDAVAVSSGPGSFTGLRIGMSVAKGLCYATGLPLVAVPTLEALAQNAMRGDLRGADCIVAALDARRDEVYWQMFEVHGTSIRPADEERSATVIDVVRQIEGRTVALTGDGAEKIRGVTMRKSWITLSRPYDRCSASSVGVVGSRMAAQHMFADPASVEPRYIKQFYTTTP